MRGLYRIGILLLGWAMFLAHFIHPKARLWWQGRKNWRSRLAKDIPPGKRWIWFHCASLGEFEQGRPLWERIRSSHPEYSLLISFYSPSGYAVRQHYPGADHVCYLPLDTPRNAGDWLDRLQPEWVFFVKYELWLEMLQELARRDIPTVLISARVGEKSGFLRSVFAPLYREAFRNFRQIFVQDEASATRLQDFCGGAHIQVSGDTRFDRVQASRILFEPVPEMEAFIGNRFCLVGGSTWPQDEAAIFEAYAALPSPESCCLILAPHEIHPRRIEQWMKRFPGESLRYSNWANRKPEHRILWIDSIGLLSRLYHYADLAYVGGGFSPNLHNVLEAATFGCPILIGPKYERWPEAIHLVEAGGAISIHNGQELKTHWQALQADATRRQAIRAANQTWIERKAGATALILQWWETQIRQKP